MLKRIAVMILSTVLGLFVALPFGQAQKKENYQWTELLTTKGGYFAYAPESLVPEPAEVEPKDIVLMQATTKVIVLDKNFLDLWQEGDKKIDKLAKNLAYLTLRLELNLTDNTYRPMELKLFDKKDKAFSQKKFKIKAQRIPPNTFVSLLWQRAEEKAAALKAPVSTSKEIDSEIVSSKETLKTSEELAKKKDMKESQNENKRI